MATSASLTHDPSSLRRAGSSSMKFTARFLQQFGARPSGTPASRRAAQGLSDSLEEVCDQVTLIPFATHPAAHVGWVSVSVVIYAISVVLMWHRLYWLAMAALFPFAFCIILQYVFYVPMLDPLFPSDVGVNVVGVIEPTHAAKAQLIIAGHHDSGPNNRMLSHGPRAYPLRIFIALITYVAAAVMSLVWTIIMMSSQDRGQYGSKYYHHIMYPTRPKDITAAETGCLFTLSILFPALLQFWFGEGDETKSISAGGGIVTSCTAVEIARYLRSARVSGGRVILDEEEYVAQGGGKEHGGGGGSAMPNRMRSMTSTQSHDTSARRRGNGALRHVRLVIVSFDATECGLRGSRAFFTRDGAGRAHTLVHPPPPVPTQSVAALPPPPPVSTSSIIQSESEDVDDSEEEEEELQRLRTRRGRGRHQRNPRLPPLPTFMFNMTNLYDERHGTLVGTVIPGSAGLCDDLMTTCEVMAKGCGFTPSMFRLVPPGGGTDAAVAAASGVPAVTLMAMPMWRTSRRKIWKGRRGWRAAKKAKRVAHTPKDNMEAIRPEVVEMAMGIGLGLARELDVGYTIGTSVGVDVAAGIQSLSRGDSEDL